jgi:hypothetical protein
VTVFVTNQLCVRLIHVVRTGDSVSENPCAHDSNTGWLRQNKFLRTYRVQVVTGTLPIRIRYSVLSVV